MVKDHHITRYQSPVLYDKHAIKMAAEAKNKDRKADATLKFYQDRPYGHRTAFGHTTIIDPMTDLATMVGISMEDAELQTLKWLAEGRHFAHTGTEASVVFISIYW